jgi:hypothetical protein
MRELPCCINTPFYPPLLDLKIHPPTIRPRTTPNKPTYKPPKQTTTTTMKLVAALLLTIATLASAVPSPNADADAAAVLSARQECVYGCGCQSDDPNQSVDPDTATCCASVGGTLGNEGTVRSSLLLLFPWTLRHSCLHFHVYTKKRDGNKGHC